jgi:hypothetical protein
MTALRRPEGDHYAADFGPYMTKKEVKKIAKGDKLDVLCSDGLNYHAVVKETGATGRLHFHHWSAKRDCIGSFDDLYLQIQGTYSMGISPQNSYAPVAKAERSGDKAKVTPSAKSSSNNLQNFPSGTRYPEDYLSKPWNATSNSRKRTAEESEDSDSKKASKETPKIEISVFHEKNTDTADQNIADRASDKTSVIPMGIEDKSMVVHDRRDKSNRHNRRSSNEKKPQIQKNYVQELNSADGNTNETVDQIDDKLDDAAASTTSSGSTTESVSTAVMNNQEDRDKLLAVVEVVLSSSASSAANSLPENSKSTAASNCESSSAAQQVSRVIPVYQLQVQRAAQIKYLREMLAMEKSITDTGRAVDTITNHPIVFNSGNSPSQYTAQELLGLLQARIKIDEVIHHMLGTL